MVLEGVNMKAHEISNGEPDPKPVAYDVYGNEIVYQDDEITIIFHPEDDLHGALEEPEDAFFSATVIVDGEPISVSIDDPNDYLVLQNDKCQLINTENLKKEAEYNKLNPSKITYDEDGYIIMTKGDSQMSFKPVDMPSEQSLGEAFSSLLNLRNLFGL